MSQDRDEATAGPSSAEPARDGADATGPGPSGDSSGRSSGDDGALPPGAIPEDSQPPRSKSRWAFARELTVIVVIALVLSFLVKTFLAQPFYIPSASMESTLDIGDRIIVSKFTPQHSPLHRGDIIVFEDPKSWGSQPSHPSALKRVVKDSLVFVGILPGGGDHVVKRIIGMPGDHVKCCTKGGKLTVNGVPITEPYINKGSVPSTMPFNITVPKDKVWVMGDNRNDSADSRLHDGTSNGKLGSVPMADVTGQVVAIAWPISRIHALKDYSNVFAKVPDPK
ncbi:signal peptidase I [Flexivirga endophytica]|uniref:Signal peptidase I n=1 Tax=Flexivirga endophytica TaxID=1849103 RepID=A0A916SYA3_9MICO|nr:signal peptidase I [Flexivirga endophytica]GGB19830.1 signal peptidase I [Flexivirga endophytica]GHB35880.1 signal peptidase I [Flexivirga endophytica]